MTVSVQTDRFKKRRSFLRRVKKHKLHLMMIIPVILWYLLFKYGPLYGVTLAFKEFQLLKGITGSPWVGLDNFNRLFNSNNFWNVFQNTIIIAGLKFLFGFPAPIILALMLNELRGQKYKRVVQSLSYLPHFISWVIFMVILSPTRGPINTLLKSMGMESIYFLGDPKYFRGTLVVTGIWKGIGWGSIVYLAAIAGIPDDLYEAARIDGANRFQQVLHVTIPSILPTIMVMLILKIGNLLSLGFEKVLLMYTPANSSVSDIIDTYVYRVGLQSNANQYSYATAIGLFSGVIGLILVTSANFLSRILTGESLY